MVSVIARNLLPRTLVLNADYQPISITSAVRSIALLREKKAHAVEMTSDVLKSELQSWVCPSVIVLSTYVKLKQPGPVSVRITPSRREILKRDGHECQYCRAPATTLDHIVPRSKGGSSTWENLVAACWPCNLKKGNMDLEQTPLRLRRAAQKPSFRQPVELINSLSGLAERADGSHRAVWRKYLPKCSL